MDSPSSTTGSSSAGLPAGRQRSRAGRNAVGRVMVASLVMAAAFSVLTTGTILYVLFSEAFHFFKMEEVSVIEYFFGFEWNPLLGSEKHFGVWPLVTGTLLVAVVSACIALPLGLITAVYLSEYAHPRVRAVLKPVLEVLAGIPTVVYGFLALTVITPAMRPIVNPILSGVNDVFDTDYTFGAYSALSGGIAVGIMCLPIVTSLTEDALRAVPRSLREGAYAQGATKFEVSMKVVVPAALSGIVAAYLLAIARAVGETMIVALAAGGLAQFTLMPTDQIQTMTAYMVQIFKGDAGFATVEYYSAYAVGATLFCMTLIITLIGGRVLKRYREVYE